jgi:hypothetical protein
VLIVDRARERRRSGTTGRSPACCRAIPARPLKPLGPRRPQRWPGESPDIENSARHPGTRQWPHSFPDGPNRLAQELEEECTLGRICLVNKYLSPGGSIREGFFVGAPHPSPIAPSLQKARIRRYVLENAPSAGVRGGYPSRPRGTRREVSNDPGAARCAVHRLRRADRRGRTPAPRPAAILLTEASRLIRSRSSRGRSGPPPSAVVPTGSKIMSTFPDGCRASGPRHPRTVRAALGVGASAPRGPVPPPRPQQPYRARPSRHQAEASGRGPDLGERPQLVAQADGPIGEKGLWREG